VRNGANIKWLQKPVETERNRSHLTEAEKGRIREEVCVEKQNGFVLVWRPLAAFCEKGQLTYRFNTNRNILFT
jgi:hypothetical protein